VIGEVADPGEGGAAGWAAVELWVGCGVRAAEDAVEPEQELDAAAALVEDPVGSVGAGRLGEAVLKVVLPARGAEVVVGRTWGGGGGCCSAPRGRRGFGRDLGEPKAGDKGNSSTSRISIQPVVWQNVSKQFWKLACCRFVPSLNFLSLDVFGGHLRLSD
jgi:hypothetical protein